MGQCRATSKVTACIPYTHRYRQGVFEDAGYPSGSLNGSMLRSPQIQDLRINRNELSCLPFSFPLFRDLANGGDETKLEKAETSYGSRTDASRRDGKIEGSRYYEDERMVIVGLGSTHFFSFFLLRDPGFHCCSLAFASPET